MNSLIPPPNILSEFDINDADDDDEITSNTEGTTQDATNDMEIDLDEVSWCTQIIMQKHCTKKSYCFLHSRTKVKHLLKYIMCVCVCVYNIHIIISL